MRAFEEIIEKVDYKIMREWLNAQGNPGIYKIIYDPDDDKVYTTATFSGDNSYIPNDNRITLACADIRESLSLETRGLDEDGDIIEGDTEQAILGECERNLEEAVNDGDIELEEPANV